MPSVSDRILRGMMTRRNEKIKKIGKFGTRKSSTDDASCKQVYLSKIQSLMHICQEKRRQNQQKAATLLHEVSRKLTKQCCTKGMQGISSASQMERLMTTVRKGRKNRGLSGSEVSVPPRPWSHGPLVAVSSVFYCREIIFPLCIPGSQGKPKIDPPASPEAHSVPHFHRIIMKIQSHWVLFVI